MFMILLLLLNSKVVMADQQAKNILGKPLEMCMAPAVILEATHEKALEYISIETLKLNQKTNDN